MRVLKESDLLAYIVFTMLCVLTSSAGAWFDEPGSTKYASVANFTEAGIGWPVWASVSFALLALVAWCSYAERRNVNPAVGVWGLAGALLAGLLVSSLAVYLV